MEKEPLPPSYTGANPPPYPGGQPPPQAYPPPGQPYPPPQQYPPPTQQYLPPTQQYPQPTAVPVQPVPQAQKTTVVVVRGGSCPHCAVGNMVEGFTPCGIILGIIFFPLGIICCMMMRELRCSHCRRLL